MENEDITLAIRAYGTAFCADIVASYVFGMTEISFLQARHRECRLHAGLVDTKPWSIKLLKATTCNSQWRYGHQQNQTTIQQASATMKDKQAHQWRSD
eukprot:480784-Ditylum_brightwellii.AAC.1